MNRTVRKIETGSLKEKEVISIINEILKPSGYERSKQSDTALWSQGDGVVMKKLCFSAEIDNGSCIIQSWLDDALTGESDLTGFVAVIPKKKMKGLLDDIENKIMSKVIFYGANSFFNITEESVAHSCPVCGSEISDEETVCSVCGRVPEAQKRCNKCGHILGRNELYCPECGFRV